MASGVVDGIFRQPADGLDQLVETVSVCGLLGAVGDGLVANASARRAPAIHGVFCTRACRLGFFCREPSVDFGCARCGPCLFRQAFPLVGHCSARADAQEP